ncbi:MAG: formate--tetrahydrofolate ligase [Planctomycetes bacterium]|nr:formate--tetrahydrofolate ligase [Planctomycetota bacterium]
MSNLLDYIKQARSFKIKTIDEVAESLGIKKGNYESYGMYKTKLSPSLAHDFDINKKGKYVVVSAITPTKFGEGKTLTTIGLSMSLNKIGKKAVCCIRQPSLGPIFGAKGGATGGGMCQVIPPEEINFFLNGDFPAVEACHNLISAFVYNHVYHKVSPRIKEVLWKRVIDINDRSLRKIKLEFGKDLQFESGFELTPASEIMALIALAGDYSDLLKRLEQIIVAVGEGGSPITTKDVGVVGPSSILLKKAFWPNLLQTCEGTPCIIHAGPFGNIAHGNSSVIADLIALKYGDFVVTECGFGAELGFEKFIDIKCRTSGLTPDCAVVVVTCRAVKEHTLDLFKHTIRVVKMTGIPCAVSINKFDNDSPADIEDIKRSAFENGADTVDIVEFFSKGGNGGLDLAQNVARLASAVHKIKSFYDLDMPVEEKIRTLARNLYLAEDIELSSRAKKSIELIRKWGYERLPICVAKNHLSLTHDPECKGIPTSYKLPITNIEVKSGAGYINVLCGNILTLPGLPERPESMNYSLNSTGEFNFG